LLNPKLSGTLPAGTEASIKLSGGNISPDGKWVVYIAGGSNPQGLGYLFSAPTDGSTPPVRLSSGDPIVSSLLTNLSFAITSDSRYVVYTAPQDTAGVFELYRVPIAGGAAVKLNGPLAAGSQILDFTLSPDNRYVVYRASVGVNNGSNLFSVPLAGGAATQLNAPLVNNANIREYTISPDSSRMVYRMLQFIDNVGNIVEELYSVPLTGGTPILLNPSLPNGSMIDKFVVTNDSRQVFFRVNTGSTYRDLYRVALAGGDATKLLGELPVDYFGLDFSLSPNNSHVVIQLFKRRAVAPPIAPALVPPPGPPPIGELYSMTLMGSTLTKLWDPTIIKSVGGYIISPDSSHVIFSAEQKDSDIPNIYSVPIGGGTLTKLNTLPPPGGVASFMVSPDSSRVVLQSGSFIFSVPLAGGSATRLNGSVPADSQMARSAISPDSSRVVYTQCTWQDWQNIGVRCNLFSVPLTGGESTKLNPASEQDGQVSGFQISPDSSRVIYVAGQQVYAAYEPAPAASLSAQTTQLDIGTVTFTVSLNHATKLAGADVLVESGGTAEAGVNYSFAPMVVHFAPGETSKPVQVRVQSTANGGANRTLVLSLNSTTTVTVAQTTTVTVTFVAVQARQFLPAVSR
jgi:Tol biopolymer transport system component